MTSQAALCDRIAHHRSTHFSNPTRRITAANRGSLRTGSKRGSVGRNTKPYARSLRARSKSGAGARSADAAHPCRRRAALLHRPPIRRVDRAITEDARARLHIPSRAVSPFDIATIYAGLGDRTKTFEYLEKAYQARVPYLVYIAVDPHFDDFRTDPRFRDLVRRIGLPAGS
jgi:hypothetical protein